MTERYSVDPSQTATAVAKASELLTVETNLLTWCSVHGCLQLALRHPNMPPITRATIELFVGQLGNALVDAGFFTGEVLREAIEREVRIHAKRLNQD